jgi:Flp pilus assembly protein TadG
MRRALQSGFLFFHAWALLLKARLWREESGNALVETAMCISFIAMPMLLGTVTLGSMAYTSIEVSNAAHAGAMYGMMSSTFAANSTGIVSAAQGEATDLGTNLRVTPNLYYACSSAVGGTQYSSQTAASSACTGGTNHALQFIQVVTSATVTSPIRCPGMPATYTLVGTSVMEVAE